MTHPTPEDRRQHPHLREIFSEAYALLQPFFDERNRWTAQPHEYLALRALRERFPELDGAAVYALLSAARRVAASGKPPAP